jgi:hypothetical protein
MWVGPPDVKRSITVPASAEHFRSMLSSLLDEAGQLGFSYVGTTAGALHRRVGGYPGPEHRMPVCCAAMRGIMGPSDRIVEQPPSGNGASLLIQFALPRPAGDSGRPDPSLESTSGPRRSPR